MKKIILFGFLIMLSFLFSPVTMVPAQDTIQNPGTYVSETSSIAPDPVDPATNYETQGGGYIQMMYEGLYQYMNNSLTQLRPSLALSNTLSDDGLTYTFTIRTGVQFTVLSGDSAAVPLNAYSIAYSINRAIIMNDHSGPAWMIQDWIKGATDVELTGDMNVTQAQTFLAQQGVKATDATHLQITLSAAFGGFLQTIQFPVAFAINPKAIIDNEPASYTTDVSDDVFGMVPLTDFFPGMSGSDILSNLGLPSNYDLANSGVVPQSDHTGPAAFTWLNDHSAGSGPYYLVDLVQGSNVDMAKNTNWWDKAEFQPNSVDNIKITQVPEDATRVLDLKNGAVDAGGIPASLFSEFMNVTSKTSTYPGVNAYVYDTIVNGFIGMNSQNTLADGQIVEDSSSTYSMAGDNYTRLLKYSWKDENGTAQMANATNPLSSLLFRQALAYSFDSDAFISQSLAGFGIRMQGAIPKGLLGYDSNLIADGNIPTYDPNTAKALFNQVGFKGTITITYNAGSTSRAIGAAILKDGIESLNVGITVNTAAVAWNVFLSGVFGGKDALFQLGWAPDFADPHDYTVPYYRTGGTFSYSVGYSNPHVDDLVNQGAAATDPVARTAIYKSMEENATGDYPYIYVYQSQAVVLLRDWINGVDDPASDSLNAMVNFLPLQFLAKGDYTSGYSQGVSSPGFEFLAILGLAAIATIQIRRKKQI